MVPDRALVLAAVVVLTLSACMASGGGDGWSDPAAAGSGTTADLETCHNTRLGYTIGYPAGWWHGGLSNDCELFNPVPLWPDASDGRPAPLWRAAVAIGALPGSIEVAQPFVTAGAVVDQAVTAVAGRPAMVVQTTALGHGDLPAGTRAYRWLVGGPDRSLVAATHAPAGEELAYRPLLDRMVRTLAFSGTSAVEATVVGVVGPLSAGLAVTAEPAADTWCLRLRAGVVRSDRCGLHPPAQIAVVSLTAAGERIVAGLASSSVATVVAEMRGGTRLQVLPVPLPGEVAGFAVPVPADQLRALSALGADGSPVAGCTLDPTGTVCEG